MLWYGLGVYGNETYHFEVRGYNWTISVVTAPTTGQRRRGI